MIDIRDGQSINIGNAGGRQLSFEVGQQRGRPGRPPVAGLGYAGFVRWKIRLHR